MAYAFIYGWRVQPYTWLNNPVPRYHYHPCTALSLPPLYRTITTTQEHQVVHHICRYAVQCGMCVGCMHTPYTGTALRVGGARIHPTRASSSGARARGAVSGIPACHVWADSLGAGRTAYKLGIGYSRIGYKAKGDECRV